MNKKVILFLNGEPPLVFPELSVYDKIYCTDGSYTYLQQHGIQPDVLSGDFDSINLKSVEHSLRIVNTPNQNYTDFEKAMQIIVDDGYKILDVYGASGKQQDHFIGNLNAAYKFKEKLKIKFFDNYSTYFFAENQTILELPVGKIVSLVPFPNCKGITTDGLLYPLHQEDLSIINRMGTRNETNAPTIKITFESGDLVLFLMD